MAQLDTSLCLFIRTSIHFSDDPSSGDRTASFAPDLVCREQELEFDGLLIAWFSCSTTFASRLSKELEKSGVMDDCLASKNRSRDDVLQRNINSINRALISVMSTSMT
jgi:hypothetical protein